MKLWGWRTRSMFDRSNLLDDDDLAAAVAKRFGHAKQGANKRKQTANIEPSTVAPESAVSSRSSS
jgi:hypothetical protein